MPIYSLRDIVLDIESLQPKEAKEQSEARYDITDQAKLILDFYVEFNSQMVCVQQGFINMDRLLKED